MAVLDHLDDREFAPSYPGEPVLVFCHHRWRPYRSAFHSLLPFGRVGEDRQRRLHECHGLDPSLLSHHYKVDVGLPCSTRRLFSRVPGL